MFNKQERLKSEIDSIKNRLAALKTLDEQDSINYYCDQLECDVIEACQSAIKHFNEMEREMLSKIDEYRTKCLQACSQREQKQCPSTENETAEVSGIQQKLNQLESEIESFCERADGFFENAETSRNVWYTALKKTEEYIKRLRSLKCEFKSQTFGGKLMTFKPHVDFFNDMDHLKEIYNFQLQYEKPGVTDILIKEEPIRTLGGKEIHMGQVNQVSFFPGGRLASCSTRLGIRIWKASDGTELDRTRTHEAHSFAILSNGWLASGSKEIYVFDLSTSRLIRTLEGHSKPVTSLLPLRDGKLASYSLDNTIKIWDPYRKAGNLLRTIRGHGNIVWRLSFGELSNGQLVTSTVDSECNDECFIKTHDPSTSRSTSSVATGLTGVRSLLVLSNDQVAIGTREGIIKIIDLNDETQTRTKVNAHGVSVTNFAQLSNRNLLSAGEEGTGGTEASMTVKMWNFISFDLLQTIQTGHTGTILSLAISADETLLATSSRDESIKLWSLTSNAV